MDFPQDSSMIIETDQLRFKQVLMNLFSNSIKYTKNGASVDIVCQYVNGK